MKNNSMDNPFVSVIIPIFNDEEGIRNTLESLSSQDYPGDSWELIVVDNNSTDNTFQVAQSFEKIIPSLKLERETKQSSYAARNKGIEVARGEILAFIDSDMTVRADWISTGVEDMERQQADYVGCRIDIYTRRNPPTVWEIYDQRTGLPVKSYMRNNIFAPTACLFIRRRIINKIGDFDSCLISGGDNEFGNRVRDAGFKMYYSDHNVMKHPARSTMTSMSNKTARRAKGELDLKWFYPTRYGPLKLLPILYMFRPPLRLLAILHLCRPPLLLDTHFKDLGMKKKLQIMLSIFFLRYVRGISQLIRYFQIKMMHIHEPDMASSKS